MHKPLSSSIINAIASPINRMHDFVLRVTRGWRLIIPWGVFIATLTWMQLPTGHYGSVGQVEAHANGHGILNTLPGYSATEAYKHLHSYTPIAWMHYQFILGADILLMIPAYVLALTGVIVRLTRRMDTQWKALLIVPVLGGICNYGEDLLIIGLYASLPSENTSLASIAGIVTITKARLLQGSLVVMALLGMKLICRRSTSCSPTMTVTHPSANFSTSMSTTAGERRGEAGRGGERRGEAGRGQA